MGAEAAAGRKQAYSAVNHCRHNPSLACIAAPAPSAPGASCISQDKALPSMHLQSMPSLRYMRLEGCLPGNGLSLPADCSFFLDVSIDKWQRRISKNQISVLRLTGYIYMPWPPSLQIFSDLQYLEFNAEVILKLDLAIFQHIPHVKLILGSGDFLRMTAGSWQSFEMFVYDELDFVISDVDTFVRNTKGFTFMSEIISPDGYTQMLVREIQEACRKHGKACHIFMHCGMLWGDRREYMTLSTSRDIAKNCPVLHEDGDAEGPAVGVGRSKTLCGVYDFWPADPCASVKRA